MKQRHFSGLGNTVDFNSFYTDQSIFCTDRYRFEMGGIYSDLSVCRLDRSVWLVTNQSLTKSWFCISIHSYVSPWIHWRFWIQGDSLNELKSHLPRRSPSRSPALPCAAAPPLTGVGVGHPGVWRYMYMASHTEGDFNFPFLCLGRYLHIYVYKTTHLILFYV